MRALNGEKKVARGPSANPIDTVIVNMERWRWMPRDLGNPHVIVNVPDFTLTLCKTASPTGTPRSSPASRARPTPMISAEMKFITVNPTWNVPPSIIENEYLPALQQDPQALDRIGLKMTQDADGTIHISQPPGAGNALGRIRFNFPNKFLVYQHDTPDKYLFAKEKRAYSHGCMRVQNPLNYGEMLLSLVMPNEHYTEAELQTMFGGSEININFPKNIRVHLTYQTAFVDDDGKLQTPRRRLRPRRQDDRHPQGQRAQGRRYRDRAAAGSIIQAGAHAGRHVWRQQWRQLWRRRLLRLPVRRSAFDPAAGISAARARRPAHRQQRTLYVPLSAYRFTKKNAGETIAGVFALLGQRHLNFHRLPDALRTDFHLHATFCSIRKGSSYHSGNRGMTSSACFAVTVSSV